MEDIISDRAQNADKPICISNYVDEWKSQSTKGAHTIGWLKIQLLLEMDPCQMKIRSKFIVTSQS